MFRSVADTGGLSFIGAGAHNAMLSMTLPQLVREVIEFYGPVLTEGAQKALKKIVLNLFFKI
jgi:hypothetical protein